MEKIKAAYSLVYLSLGSNLGDRFQNLKSAIELIGEKAGYIVNKSSVYETPPLGFKSDDYFYNCCIAVQTTLQPGELLELLLQIEKQLGRQQKTKMEKGEPVYFSRPIDIDIIFYDHLVLISEKLRIPHALFDTRKFVLSPLAEIAGDYTDPRSGLKINELLSICVDISELRKASFEL